MPQPRSGGNVFAALLALIATAKFLAALIALVLALTLSLALTPAPCLAGGTYTVSNLNDSGAGSLRQAILNLNGGESTTSANTLDFTAAVANGIIALNTGLLPTITRPAYIKNDSGGSVTVNADGNTGLNASATIRLSGANALTIVVNSATTATGITGSAGAGSDLNIDTFGASATVQATATGYQGVARGLYAGNNLSISGGLAGTVQATSTGAGAQAYGILAGGSLNGGSAGSPLTISGTVSATANGLAVAVGSGGAMNLRVTGSLSGVDTSGGGAGYAIRAGSPNGSGGWVSSSADNTVTLDSGAKLTGKVDLGSGTNTLNLYGTGSTDVQIIGVTNLAAGDGVNTADWTLNPNSSAASFFGNLTVNNYAALSINENVTIVGNTVNNGKLTFDIGTYKSYGGVISGTGSVTKTGTGTLSLRGNNTYSGGTTINQGTLNISSDSNLGEASAPVTFNGGTLQAGAALTTARTLTVSGPGALDNNGNTVTLSGSVTGSGAFTFMGTGSTTILGNGSAYSGQATLQSGTLFMAASGSLGGTLTTSQGSVLGGYGTLGNLVNNGVVSPGGSIGTLNVAGNYTQGPTAALIEEIDPSGRADLLKVSGSATLNGGLLIVSAPIAFYPTGAVWQAVSAGGGLTGSYSQVASTFPSYILSFLPVYTPNGALILATRTPYSMFASNSRAASAGNGLNLGAYTATGTFAGAILSMDLASPASIASSLDHLHPEPYDAFTQTGFDTGRLLTASVQSRLHNLRTGESPATFASPFDTAPSHSLAFNDLLRGPSQAVVTTDSEARVGLFLKPFGMTARQGSSGGRTSYANTAWGMMGGVDIQLFRNVVAGLYGGYTSRNLSLGAPASDTGRADTAGLGAFSSWFGDNWFVEGSARFGLDSYQARRSVSVPAASFKASSNWTGWNLFANLGAGYEWRLDSWSLGPVGSLDFARIAQNGYSESGAGPVGLDVHPRADASLQTALGARIARRWDFSWARLTPEVRLLWGHEWLSGSRDITANYQGLASARFTTKTVPPASDWAAVSAAVTLQRDRFSISARMSTDLFRQGYQSLSGSLSLRYTF